MLTWTATGHLIDCRADHFFTLGNLYEFQWAIDYMKSG